MLNDKPYSPAAPMPDIDPAKFRHWVIVEGVEIAWFEDADDAALYAAAKRADGNVARHGARNGFMPLAVTRHLYRTIVWR